MHAFLKTKKQTSICFGTEIAGILDFSYNKYALEANQNEYNLPYEQFLQQIEMCCTFLGAKQVGRNAREISIYRRNCSQGSNSYFVLPLIARCILRLEEQMKGCLILNSCLKSGKFHQKCDSYPQLSRGAINDGN